MVFHNDNAYVIYDNLFLSTTYVVYECRLMVTSVYTKLGMHYKCELMRCHKFSQGCPKIYLDMLPIKLVYLFKRLRPHS